MASANLIKDIRKEKLKLINKAKAKGVYEDFGQKEYLKLKEKYSRYFGIFTLFTDNHINNELADFFNWCINFDDKKLMECE